VVAKRGKPFADDEEIVKDLYAASFDTVIMRWKKCISTGGGYVEKCFFQVRKLHVLRFVSICDLFTESPSYNLKCH
jgi:hypothetical protein